MPGMMRVAMIGLGDIARKAYLPVLAARADLDLSLMTRNRAVLDELGDAHRIRNRHTDMASLLAGGLDAAFVHAATEAHAVLVEPLLLAGIPVYVDKPLDYGLAGSERLVRLAESRGCSLMVGFNRRFAPLYAGLLDHPRDLILMQKNRTASADAPRRMVFDDFIHVVDTLRFLAPGPVRDVDVRWKLRDGMLHHVLLTLSGEGFSAVGVMNRMSGSTEEILEAMGDGSKRTVLNLADRLDHRGEEVRARRGDWTPVARQRGIEQACAAFLDAVREGRRLSAEDALRTHALCEEIVTRIEGSGVSRGLP